jgi:hypothetical protein
LTPSDTDEISFFFSGRARFHTSHRNTAWSSSFEGTMERVAVVGWSREPPFFSAASRGYVEPETAL